MKIFGKICKSYANKAREKDGDSAALGIFQMGKQIMQWYFEKHVKWPNKLEIHVFKITDADGNKYFL